MTTLYSMDQIYHAERPKTEAEQREVDRVNAEFAAAGAGLWRAGAASWQSLRRVALRQVTVRARRHRKAPTQWHQPRPLPGTGTSPRSTRDEHAEKCSSAR
jgi:hypothetical protein